MSIRKILVVDDHEAARRGICSLLSSRRPDWSICGEASDGLQAVEKAKQLLPDVILMDISMPRMNGLEATKIIRKELPKIKVLIVSQNDPAVVGQQAAQVKAHGFVSKADLSAKLIASIEMADKVDNGNSFDPSPSETQSYRLEDASAIVPSGRVNILMIDDEPAKLLTYEAILAETGENLIATRSGPEALECLLHTDIAVILMDVNMPGQDGFGLAETIRQHPRFQNLPIIFVSGVYLTDHDRLRGYAHGAVDYIPLPIIPELLRAKVRLFAELNRKNRQLEALNREMHELSNGVIRLRDEERRHIACELHDGLGQELAMAKMSVEAVLSAEHLSNAKEKAEEVRDVIERAIRQVRSVSYLLHPPLLDEVGLHSALRFYVEELTKRSGIELSMEVVPSDFPRLPPEVELAIFRIIQEALTNVFRHSEAHNVWITLRCENGRVMVEGRDNGKGTPEQAMDLKAGAIGVGISGMKQRVRELGGELLFRNANPGTLVQAVVPIRESQPPATSAATPPESV